MFEFLKEIKDLRKTELWGVVIIAGFNLTAVITAISNIEKFGVSNFFMFFLLLQACTTPLYILLFRFYSIRLGVDDTHEAARNIHITMEKITEGQKETREMMQTAMKAVELLSSTSKCTPSCPLLTDNKDKK